MVSRLTPIHSSNDMHKYFGLLNVQKHLLSILNEAFKSDMYFAVKIGRQKMYFSPLMHFLRTSSPRCCTFSPSFCAPLIIATACKGDYHTKRISAGARASCLGLTSAVEANIGGHGHALLLMIKFEKLRKLDYPI
jgi:hypothetical protein